MKRSILGSRVYAPSPTEDGAPVTGVVQAVKQENRDASCAGGRRSVYTVLMQDGSLKEFAEEEIATGFNHSAPKGPLKSSLKVRMRVRRAPQPAGCAPLGLLCAVLQHLTASCTEQMVAVSPPPRPLLTYLFQTRLMARVHNWRHFASNCRLSRRLVTAYMRDKGLDSACAMFMWAGGCVSRGKQTLWLQRFGMMRYVCVHTRTHCLCITIIQHNSMHHPSSCTFANSYLRYLQQLVTVK